MILDRSFESSPNSSSSALRAGPPREEDRGLLPISIVFLLSNEEETSPPTSLGLAPSDPLPNLSYTLL